jgi:hypothetical protein
VPGTASTHAYFNVGGNGPRYARVGFDRVPIIHATDIDAGATAGLYPRRSPGSFKVLPLRFFSGNTEMSARWDCHVGDDTPARIQFNGSGFLYGRSERFWTERLDSFV